MQQKTITDVSATGQGPESRTTPIDRASSFEFRHAFRKACLWLPLTFGVLALMLGQDSNWDLRNYHLYNPYAWLHDRISIDLAPAGLQSYFNPLLDALQMQFYQWLPAPMVGFLLGWTQGLNGLLLISIGRRILPADSSPRRVILLAISGSLAACFLSELGSAMGDNLTATLVLGSCVIALDAQGALVVRRLLAAGALVGVATGLKLTNAIYALGLVGAVWCCAPAGTRIARAVPVGVGALTGLLGSAGYWFWHLWKIFGNPLFPQFGTRFPNPLAADVNVADLRFVPHGLWEVLGWPLVFSFVPSRIGEHGLPQLAWPCLYLLLIALAVTGVWQRWRGQKRARLDRSTRLMMVFVLVSFLSWMTVFSIHRYLVPVEMLAPLLCWQLIHALIPARWADVAAKCTVTAIALVGLSNYWRGWGHASWSDDAFRVEQPALPMDSAARGTVLLAGTEPMAWRIPFLPPQLAFVGVGTSFPAGPGYASRVHDILRQRHGPIWVMLPAANYPHRSLVVNLDGWMQRLHLGSRVTGCAWLRALSDHFRLRAKLVTSQDRSHCRFELRDQDRIAVSEMDRLRQTRAEAVLAPYGVVLAKDECRRYDSWIGRSRLPYLWCPAHILPQSHGLP